MNKIDRDSLKTGDVVGVCRQARIQSSFRYAKIVPMKIKRITPSRTKIIMENDVEYDRYECFYEIDEETINQTYVTEYAEKLIFNLNKLCRFNANGVLLSISDKTIIAVCDLLSQTVEQIENDNE